MKFSLTSLLAYGLAVEAHTIFQVRNAHCTLSPEIFF